MKNLSHRVGRIGEAAAAVGAAVLVVGCGLTSVGAQAGGQATGPAVTITQAAVPSALLAVTAGPASCPALCGLMTSTARPREDVRILQAGAPAKTIVASNSPAPAQVVISGPPIAPGGGQTAYQSALYAKKLQAWRAERAADLEANAAETRERVSVWLRRLELPQLISSLADPTGDQGSLSAESAVAASAMADLEEEAGNIFGSRRVVVLFASDLGGALPAGELTGEDVIVATSYLPSAAAASAAQAELLGAGAAQATVIGPEVTAAQFSALVSADLSQDAMSDSISTPVLFGNGSAALDAAAVRQLTQLLARLRVPGTTVVINGYASVPGTAYANYVLSYQRAANVAGFFESHGTPASWLIIVGHGATSAFGSGTPDANRRVLVVTEKSGSAR
jgi:outer membrane protein OmpA-like peptidoglycan-associated protein